MKFEFETNDTRKISGIEAARLAYNAALPDEFQTITLTPAKPAEPPSEDNPDGVPAVAAVTERRAILPKPGTLASMQAYVQFVMDRASESYSKQYQT